MKLHLPLGLLAAVLMSFAAVTPRAQAVNVLVRTPFFPEDWVPSETIENAYNLDISSKFAMITSNRWTLYFTSKNPSASKKMPAVFTEGYDGVGDAANFQNHAFVLRFQRNWAQFATHLSEEPSEYVAKGGTYYWAAYSTLMFELQANPTHTTLGELNFYTGHNGSDDPWYPHWFPYSWYGHLNNGETSPIQWLSFFTPLGEDGLPTTLEVEFVKNMDDAHVFTWTAEENTTLGMADADLYDGYLANGEHDLYTTMVEEAGLQAREHFGSDQQNGSYSKLRFLAEGTYYTGTKLLTADAIGEVNVGTGVTVTTDPEWGFFHLGGIIVAQGATGYAVESGAEGGIIKLGSSGNGQGNNSYIEFTIGEDFSLGAPRNAWRDIIIEPEVTDLVFDIAEDKVFTIYGRISKDEDVPDTDQVDVSLTLLGGGTLALRWGEIYYLGENPAISIYDGTTLDMGGASMKGDMYIFNGGLRQATEFEGRISILADEESGPISLGGASADMIETIWTTSSNTRVYDIGAGTLVLDSFGDDNWQQAPAKLQVGSQHLTPGKSGGTYLIEFNDPENSKIVFADTDGVTAKVVLTLDEDLKFELAGGFVVKDEPELDEDGNVIGGDLEAGDDLAAGGIAEEPEEPEYVEGYEGYRYLWLSNADFDVPDLDFSDYHAVQEWFKNHFIVEPGVTLDFAYEVVEGSPNGKLQFIMSATHIWYSSIHGEYIDVVDKLNDWSKWHQVVVDSKMDFNITPMSASGNTIVLRYLSSMGKDSSDGGKLTITRNDYEDFNYGLTVELNNARRAPWGSEVQPDSVFLKDIVINDDAGLTTLHKVGEGKLTLGGNVTSKGMLRIDEEGTLEINGDDSTVGSLSGINGTLSIGGKLTVLDDSDVRSDNPASRDPSSGSITGDGTLSVQGEFYAGSRLTTQNSLLLDIGEHATVHLDNDLSTNLGGLSGSGTLDLNGYDLPTTLTLDGKEGVFTGNFVSEAWTGTIDVVNENTHQTLQNAGIDTWDLKVRRGACLTLIGTGEVSLRSRATTYNSLTVGGTDPYDDSSAGYLRVSAQGAGSEYAAGTTVYVKQMSIGEDAVVEFCYNFAGVAGEDLNIVGPMVVSTGNIYIERDAIFLLSSLGSSFGLQKGEDLDEVVVMHSTEGIIDGYYADGESLKWDTAGIFMIFYRDIDLKVRGNDVVLSGRVQHDNIYAPIVTSYSAGVGGRLLWDARFAPSMSDPDSLLYNIINYTALEAIKGDANKASRVLAAVAGSTVPTLGTAQRDALRSQLTRMRDHAGVMGLDVETSYDELPFYHCWVEGAGHFAKLANDGYDSGYKLNSWGGSVGADVDVDNTTTVGLALTAFYGDFSAGSADRATGDMDSVYLSFVGRFRKNSWTHTLVASFGLNDFSVERTVDYGLGTYRTKGDTSGWGLAAMYEVTYDYVLNEEATSVLQPLLNVSVAKTALRAYSETGVEDMALNVGKQEWMSASVGLGVRWLREVGTTIFDRSAQLELRANVSQDVGDTRGESSVALHANPSVAHTMKAVEAGTTALQLGAGLRVPLQDKAMIFTNASADIRSGMTSWNVSAGLKYTF